MTTEKLPSLQPKTPVRREAVAGLTTFLAMAYIVVVNPAMLASEGTGMPFEAVLTATVSVCFLMTLAMGLYSRLPFAVAPGMGLNAFFTYTLILDKQIPWPTALGMVFWSGVLFLLISITPLRERLAEAIPQALRLAIAAGIGIFLTLIGFRNLGLVASDPVTLLRMGDLSGETLLGLTGLLICALLLRWKKPWALLAGMLSVTLAAGVLGWLPTPETWLRPPDFTSLWFQADLWEAWKLALLPALISLLFTDLFDSISTFMGVCHANAMLDERGEPLRLRQGLLVDAVATVVSGLAGTSPATSYIESSAGIQAGGRTGLTAVFTALCFLPCLWLSSLAAMVPAYATAPVLILVGLAMFSSLKNLSLAKIEKALPAYLTVLLIPLTFSITQGILWGLIAYSVLHLLAGKGRQISPTLWLLAGLSVILLWLEV